MDIKIEYGRLLDVDTIRITKVNEVYAKIETYPHILKELSEYFTFPVPGHTFAPAFRSKKWDGKIRLLQSRTGKIYIGLLKYVEEFADDNAYKVHYTQDRLDIADDFSLYLGEKFFDELNIHAHGEKITKRDYQIEAFVHAMRHRRALLLSPTASGKSLIMYLLIRQMIDYKNYRGLIIVPTTTLVEQLYGDFREYSEQNGFSVEDNVHRIYEGHSKFTDKKLIISTWQSLYTLDSKYFEQFDYVIGDEAHLFKAQSLTHIMTSCTNAKYRIGLTGSLDNTKTHKLVLEGLFGPVEKVTTSKELMDQGYLAKINIKCLILKHNDDDSKKIMKLKDYRKEIEYLILSEERNRFIKNLALSLKDNTLILYQFVDKHGQILYDSLLNAENLGNKKVYFVHGGVETEDREIIRKLMEESNENIVVASFGTFSTGINIRNLHHVIFASPSKSRIRVLQSIGRGVRLFQDKIMTLYDIADDMRVGKYMNTTLRHFVERVKIYAEEKFPYKLYKIGLKSNGKNGK